MVKELKLIHDTISHIQKVQINAIRILIQNHNLGSANLECTLVDINLKQQLDHLELIISTWNKKINKKQAEWLTGLINNHPDYTTPSSDMVAGVEMCFEIINQCTEDKQDDPK